MTALLQDIIRKIDAELKLLPSNNQISSYLTIVEQKIGLKREQITLYGLVILIVYLVFGWGKDFLCDFIGFVYPAYASLLAVGSPAMPNDTKWLIYWVIYISFGFVEYFGRNFFHTLPCYWLCKCVFLIWLMRPGQMGGTHIIYYRIIRRFILQKNENLYNPVAGMSNINNASSYDEHGNPTDRMYDLGRDGAFSQYRILIGQFYTSGDMKMPIDALKVKGFQVENVKNESDFISKLGSNRYQIAWVISSGSIQDSAFISTLTAFHSSGGAIFLFADNIPYVCHASEFLNRKFGITLTGNFQGNKTLVYKENGYLQTGSFGKHEIFTGIKNLFEGVTICHPVYSTPASRTALVTLATATDGNPCIVVLNPPGASAEGRLCLDCGFTKLFINWDSAGTARYIVNVSCWLAGVERRLQMSKMN